MRVELDATVDAATRDMAAAWGRAWDEIVDDWSAAIDDLIAASDDGWPTVAQIARAKRAQQALQVASDALDELAQATGVRILSDVSALAPQVAGWMELIAATQLPETGATATFSRVSPAAIRAIVQRSTQQVTSLTRPLSAEATAAMRSALIRGVAVGDHPERAAARMLARSKDGFNGGLWRARNIARTEMLDSHRAAANLWRTDNADIMAGWTWVAELSNRTCPACLGMHGTRHPVGEPGPLGHQSCLLPGAIVSGPRATAATSRWFAGEVIDIETAGGNTLSVTPNHPILTPKGWVAAGLLNEGNDLISGSLIEGPSVDVIPDDHQVPARIEDVFSSLGKSGEVQSRAVPTSAEDFHGDGGHGDVDVVAAEGSLLLGNVPTTRQHGGERVLALGDSDSEILPGLRRQHQGVLVPGAAQDSGTRSGHALLNFGGAQPSHRKPVRLRHSTDGHTCGRQSSANDIARDAIRFGEAILRFACKIPGRDLSYGHGIGGLLSSRGLGATDGSPLRTAAPIATFDKGGLESDRSYSVPSRGVLAAHAGHVVTDRIVKIRRRAWSGHVYNLQTETGWYVANSIVVHNCRCTSVPITKTWRELGFDIDEPEPIPTETGEEWLAAQSVDVQKQVLGPKGWKAWQAGDWPSDQWAVRRENPAWRASFVVAPVPA